MRIPVLLDVRARRVVGVGGGPVAAAKLRTFLDAGADVTVIAPTLDPMLAGRVTWHARRYGAGDLAGAAVVVAATGDGRVDAAAATEAAEAGAWCLRVDGRGDLALPAVVRRGRLVVALSSGVPALTAELRQRLEAWLPAGWQAAAERLAGLRADPAVRATLHALPVAERRRRWRAAAAAALDGQDPRPHLS